MSTYYMPGSSGTVLGTEGDWAKLGSSFLQRISSRRKAPNNKMISWMGPCFEGLHRSWYGDDCISVWWGKGRDPTWSGAVKNHLPEDIALELRAEEPAGVHRVKAGWGGALRRRDRMSKGPVQTQEGQYRWDLETAAGKRQGLCHAGPWGFPQGFWSWSQM